MFSVQLSGSWQIIQSNLSFSTSKKNRNEEAMLAKTGLNSFKK